jgi:acyl carrier protein
MSDRLVEMAATVFELEPAQVHDAMSPAEVPTWDSFTHVMLITQVEETFRVRLEPRELTGIKTIGDIRTLLRKRGIQS